MMFSKFYRFALLLTVILLLGFQTLPSYGRADDRKDVISLNLSNNNLQRTLRISSAKPCLITSSMHLGSGRTAWCSPDKPSVEYLLKLHDSANERVYEISSADQAQAVAIQGAPNKMAANLSLSIRRTDLPIKIDLFYESYPGHALTRQWLTVTNQGPVPLVLDEVSLVSLQLDLPADDLAGLCGFERQPPERWPVWFQPRRFELSNDLMKKGGISFMTGRWQAATWIALWRKSKAEGLIFGWETGAPTYCQIGDPFSSGRPGVQVMLRPAFTLDPGESFVTPKSFINLYEGDLDEGCYQVQRFAEQQIAWPIPDNNFPYVMFNSWGYERAIDEKLSRDAINLCAKLGLEVFVADFGWEGPDWQAKPDTFPHGLAPLADLCHANNFKFGIHFSFANVAHQSTLYKEHPELVYGDGFWAYGQGKEPVHALSLGLPEARKWAVDKVTEVLDRDKVDWFLTDSQLWGEIDPKLHNVRAEQNYLAATGFEQTMEAIHASRPGVLIEHCDGGLSLINYKMMRQHVTSITCDNANAIDTRLSVFELSHILPPRYLDKYQQEWRSHYANRSCMFGGPWILMMPIHTLKPGSRDWNELSEDIALYKKYREHIRDGKVLHLLSPADPKDKNWDGWDAIGSYHPASDKAIVFAFRTKGNLRKRSIPMKDLKPEGRYRVNFHDTGLSYKASGREIMRQGIPLELDSYADNKQSHCSEVILIEPVPNGASKKSMD